MSRSIRGPLLISLVLLPLVALPQFAGLKPVPPEYKKGFDAITQSDAKNWLSYLAGPECQGRGTGQPGFQKAADYVAARFKEFGLKPIGDNGTYFQHVPFMRFRIDPRASYLSNADGSGRVIASKAFTVNSGVKMDLVKPVAFVRVKGNGAIPNLEALKDRIVIVFSEGGPVSRRLRNDLFRSGAALTLTVTDKVDEPVWTVRPGKAADFRGGGGRATSGTISNSAAKLLLKTQEVDEAFLTKPLEADTLEVTAGTEDVKVSTQVHVEDVQVPNVVGLLEGSDPVLKEEVVAAGAHLDHMGTDGTTTWWGADDDGSGSTALIGVAKAFSVNKARPKRSVLFMAFCGEEMGLIGSAYFAANPIVPLDKIQCLMQMDMVGRDSFGAQNGDQKRIDKVEENRDTMRLVGSKRISQELDDIIQETNQHIGFQFKYDGEDVYTRSDHYNFAKNGIPIAFQFCGFTPDYHQPTDTVDKINFEKVTNAAKLSYLTLMRVGNMDSKLKRNGTDSK